MISGFGAKAMEFYAQLSPPADFPPGVSVMNPYRQPAVKKYLGCFFEKFFSSRDKRVLILGINPGRFGGGLTGISFTDPVALQEFCGIPNDLPKKRELSSVFIYEAIQKWGGVKEFYRKFYLSAVCPLGLTKGNTNCNYYDRPELLKALEPFIIGSIQKQLEFGVSREHVVLLGRGQNLKFFDRLNRKFVFFKTVHALEHPRFILQYRRPLVAEYLQKYQNIFSSL